MSANVFAYFFNIIAGRIFSDTAVYGPSAYGEFFSLSSFSYYFVVPVSALQLVSSKLVAEWYSKKETEKIAFYIEKTTDILLKIFLVATIAFIAASPLIQYILKIENIVSILIFIPSVTLVFIPPAIIGGLIGVKRFDLQAIINSTTAFFRLFFGALLGSLFGVPGAVAGSVFAALVNLFWAKIFYKKIPTVKVEHEIKINFPKKLFVGSIISTLAFGSFLTTDVIMVKFFLTGAIEGQSSLDAPSVYAMLSMFGRIVYFANNTFSNIITPITSSAKAEGGKHFNILLRILFLSVIILTPVIIMYFAAPETLINIIYGKEYLSGAYLLGIYGLSVALYSLASIINNYLISQDRFGHSFIPLFAAALQIILAFIFNSSIKDFVYIQLIVNIINITGLIIFLIIKRK